MTFKHIKFEDSVVMRSLEKLYKEKGLIKEESLKKEASSKLDLRASSNLMENILKLCTGLRSYGLDKQANELESNYLSYKKANTLYETSKENGEDLINAAHPKGSHKVDVLGDDLAVVETILDRHLKMIKVVDKVPTGKLASSNIINSVKKALGSDPEGSYDSIETRANLLINQIITQMTKFKTFINNIEGESMTDTVKQRVLTLLNKINLSADMSLNDLIGQNMLIQGMHKYIEPDWYSDKKEKELNDILYPVIFKIQENSNTLVWLKKYLNKNKMIEQLNDPELVANRNNFYLKLLTDLNNLKNNLRKPKFDDREIFEGNEEIDEKINRLNKYKDSDILLNNMEKEIIKLRNEML